MEKRILSKLEVIVIANDFKDLWRYKAITDKDHGQVEDLILSHVAQNERIEQLEKALEKISEFKHPSIETGFIARQALGKEE